MRIACVVTLLALTLGLVSSPAQAQFAMAVSVRIGPPLLPVYVQPLCPGPGFVWIPGYWAYGPYGYFWVPGTWVEPPEVGLLWTPGYWGFEDAFYVWHAGYWGPVVGFYGGVNYGFGYPGTGFFGGYWRGRDYYYNRAVTNVNVTNVRNVYNTTVVNQTTTVNRASFNGGQGGTTARATPQELEAARNQRVGMTSEQEHHLQAASTDRRLLASANHGRPEVAATPRPGEFNRNAAPTPTPTPNPGRPSMNPNRPEERNRTEVAPREPGSVSRAPMNTAPVNPKLEQKHQQQMDQLRQRQDTEQQKMQQQQMREQEKMNRQRPDQARMSELQNRQQHAQDQMNQRHAQQTQQLQERQQKEIQKQHGNGRPSDQHEH